MNAIVKSAAAACFLLGSSLGSAAHLAFADEAVLRHTTYAITIGTRITSEAGGSGIGMDVRHKSSTAAGSSNGTITLDVLTSSAKGGLLVSVAEEAGSQKGAPTRVIVGKGGELYYRSQIHEEERQLARLFARNLIPTDRVDAQTRWKLTAGEETVDYRVVRIIDAQMVEIAFDGTVKIGSSTEPGVRPGVVRGRVIYDVLRSIPKRLECHIRSQASGELTTTTSEFDLVAELKEDVVSPTPSPSP